MSSKFNKLAGSGLTALAMLSVGAQAEARAHHKMHHKVAHAAHASTQPSEIAELKAQIEALEARLEAQEAAQRITADEASTAAASVATGTAAMKATLAENSKAVAAQVKSAINASAPKPNWTSDTTVSGRMFFDISNINQNNGAGKVVPSGTGFDIKRLYLGVNHTFDKHFSAGMVIDAQAGGVSSGSVPGNAPGQTATRLNGANFYVKNAYLQYKFSDALIVRAGASDMPWIPFAEGIYGNRYIENLIEERLSGFGNSADWGLHVNGLLGNPKSFNVTYAVSAVNGAGYRSPVRSNSVDLEGRIAANYKGATVAVGGYTGKLAADVQNVVTNPVTAPIRTATRFNALIGYVDKRFRVGAEYFFAKDFTQAIVLGAAENATWGYSAYGTVYVTPKWSVFGRYDTSKPSKYLATYRRENYLNAGITYSPAKIVDLSLVYKRDTVNSNWLNQAPGTVGTANGTIGSALANTHGTYDEIGIFGQWRF